MPAYRISLGFFALKTNQKIAIFVWIFTCVDFRGKITTKVCRNRERYHLISWHLSSAFKTPAPPQCFKPRIVIKIGFFVFLWIDLNPRGVQGAKKTSRKRLWKPKKFFPRFGRHRFYFSNFFAVLFDRFVVFTSCMPHLGVSRLKTTKYQPPN